MLYLGTELCNLVGRGPTAVTTSPAADAKFPVAKLYDRIPARIFRFGSIGTDGYLQVDANLIGNGTFEASVLAGWFEENTGSGATSETGTVGEVHSGSKALKCVAGSGYASRWKPVKVMPGELLQALVWARTVTSGQAELRIYCEETGHWLVGGVWGPTPGYAFQVTATAYAGSPQLVTFQVEDWDSCAQQPKVTLRYYLRASAGTAVFDDVALYPAVNFCSLHGHNLSPVITPKLLSDTAAAAFGGGGAQQAQMTVRRPAFYADLSSPVFAPLWRLKFEGTPTETIYVGQWVLGYKRICGAAPAWGYGNDYAFQQDRDVTPGGETFVFNRSEEVPVKLTLDFAPDNNTDLVQLRDEIYKGNRGGAWPLIIVPIEGEPAVHFGRIAAELSVERTFVNNSETTLPFEESPFPIVSGPGF